MAFSGVAALIAAAGTETAITATMVLSAVAEVGTALTVVGAVTGSKDLMKIGGVMGLVGGIGSLAAGAFSSTAAAGAADSVAPSVVDGAVDSGASGAADAASGAADVTGEAITNPLDARLAAGTATSPGLDASGLSTGIDSTAGAVSDAANAAGSGTTTLAPGDAAAGQTSVAAPTDTSVAGQTAAAQPMQAAPNVGTPAGDVTGTVSTGPTPAITNPTDARLQAGTQVSPQTAPLDSTSYLQKIMSFAQDPKNKTVLELGAKLAGGAMQGMQQQKQFDAKLALDQQKVNQTSYGTQVGQNRPHGIIKGARA